METFNYTPISGASGDNKYNVYTAQFGDGYSQSVANGINNRTSSWSLSFEVLEDDAESIVGFFHDHAGYLPFEWTPPLEESSKTFVVLGYKVTAMTGQCPIYRIDATFEERYI